MDFNLVPRALVLLDKSAGAWLGGNLVLRVFDPGNGNEVGRKIKTENWIVLCLYQPLKRFSKMATSSFCEEENLPLSHSGKLLDIFFILNPVVTSFISFLSMYMWN